MLEILQFTFSSFWIWLGMICIIATILFGFAAIIEAIRG